MTFAEYNTDTNFDDNNSSLEELVKIGLKEGKTGDEIKGSLSPKWQKSMKIGEFDNYVKQHSTAPKTETKEEVKETIKPNNDIKLSNRDAEYLEKTNNKSKVVENDELNTLAENKDKDYDQTFDTLKRSGQLFKSIDDHYLENLPTFLSTRYKNGEFGEPGSKDAKARLGYFIMNGVQNTLKGLSNSFAANAGRAPIFNDVTTDYDKLQNTNFANAMDNRWNKYKQETNHAIELASKRDMTEEEAYDSVKIISRNRRLQTAFNMMDEDQKLYLMNVTKEIGDKIGSFNNDELIDFLIGAIISGDKLTWQETAGIAIAKFGPDAVKKLKEGKNKVEGDSKTAGFGSNGKNKVTLSDGTKINPGITMNDDEYNQIVKKADELSQRYYDGEITEEEFLKDYNLLEDVMKEHPIKGLTKNIKPAKDIIRVNNVERLNQLDGTFEELQAKAERGELSVDDYKEQYSDLIENAKKWGADAKMLKGFEKSQKTDKQINGYIEKAKNKKK